jgi:hypothetical protein
MLDADANADTNGDMNTTTPSHLMRGYAPAEKLNSLRRVQKRKM